MKRKKDDDPHQSSLDSFANIELPSMPDLDKLAKADKILGVDDTLKQMGATTGMRSSQSFMMNTRGTARQ